MRVLSLEHVPFEDAANIAVWATQRGHEIVSWPLYREPSRPVLADWDWLVVMGGPMNVDEEEQYPWLAWEKDFIRQAIAAGKLVLGVCLGAQLIAAALGAQVRPNPAKEIGWFPVRLTPSGMASPLFAGMPQEFMAFHWHGDTFDLPSGAVGAAASAACAQQALIYGDRVLGLQFHLESTPQSVQRLIDNCRADLGEGPYIQTAAGMLNQLDLFLEIERLMIILLDNLACQGQRSN